MNKPKRGFVVPDGMKDLIDGAKVGTKDGEGETPLTPPAVPEAGEPGKTGTAPEAPGAAQPLEVAQPPAEPPKTPPAPAPQAAVAKPKPWEDLSRGAKGLNLPMSAELYAKMVWCTENVPKMSLQKLARLGAEKMADELIAQHYKGE